MGHRSSPYWQVCYFVSEIKDANLWEGIVISFVMLRQIA